MFQLHDFSVYHPNSYIASRRSSLPRQGYGGVYERRISYGVSLTPSPSSNQLGKGPSTLPRNLSDFSLRSSPTSKPPVLDAETVVTPRLVKPPIRKSTSLTCEQIKFIESRDISKRELSPPPSTEEESSPLVSRRQSPERPPSPPLAMPDVTVTWRSRGDAEKKLLRQLLAAQRSRGHMTFFPSLYFCRLVAEYAGLDVVGNEEIDVEPENNSNEDSETPELSSEEWNDLIKSLVSLKKEVRTFLDKDYRDSKRQASQMRQTFEKHSEPVVSRFDRLISDILCYSRLVCHLARQNARLGNNGLVCRSPNLTTLIEDKRNVLKKQLSELPRLRRSLLLRQASLMRICADNSVETDLLEKFSAYWSFSIQLCVIDSEIVLDNELIQR